MWRLRSCSTRAMTKSPAGKGTSSRLSGKKPRPARPIASPVVTNFGVVKASLACTNMRIGNGSSLKSSRRPDFAWATRSSPASGISRRSWGSRVSTGIGLTFAAMLTVWRRAGAWRAKRKGPASTGWTSALIIIRRTEEIYWT